MKSLRVLRPGGLAIGIGGPPDPGFAGQLGKPLLRPVMALLSRKVRSAARKNGVRYSFLFMRASGEQLGEITALVDAGMIRPVIDRVFAFGRTPRRRWTTSRLGAGQGQGRRHDGVAAVDPPGPAASRLPPMRGQRSQKSRPQKGTAVNNQQEARNDVVTSYKDAPTRTIAAGGVDFRLPRARPEDRGPGDLPHPPGRASWTTGTRESSTASPPDTASSPSTTGASALPAAPRRTPSRRWPQDAVTFIRALGLDAGRPPRLLHGRHDRPGDRRRTNRSSSAS